MRKVINHLKTISLTFVFGALGGAISYLFVSLLAGRAVRLGEISLVVVGGGFLTLLGCFAIDRLAKWFKL